METQDKQEILQAINSFANHVEDRFIAIDGKFTAIDSRFDAIDTRLTRVEALMVTKDYLDDKLADLKGDLVVLTRREDEALGELVQTLYDRETLTADDVARVNHLRPFPKQPLG